MTADPEVSIGGGASGGSITAGGRQSSGGGVLQPPDSSRNSSIAADRAAAALAAAAGVQQQHKAFEEEMHSWALQVRAAHCVFGWPCARVLGVHLHFGAMGPRSAVCFWLDADLEGSGDGAWQRRQCCKPSLRRE